jgi:esterase/lipase
MTQKTNDIIKLAGIISLITLIVGTAFSVDFRYALASDLNDLSAVVEAKADKVEVSGILKYIQRIEIRRMKREASILERHPNKTELEEYQLTELQDAIDEAEDTMEN